MVIIEILWQTLHNTIFIIPRIHSKTTQHPPPKKKQKQTQNKTQENVVNSQRKKTKKQKDGLGVEAIKDIYAARITMLYK